jgi:hypothetical protein
VSAVKGMTMARSPCAYMALDTTLSQGLQPSGFDGWPTICSLLSSVMSDLGGAGNGVCSRIVSGKM